MPKANFNPRPYGIWTMADGTQVMFSRSYHPLYQRKPGEAATPWREADPWVRWCRQDYFFDRPLDKKMLARLRQIKKDFIAGKPIEMPTAPNDAVNRNDDATTAKVVSINTGKPVLHLPTGR